MGTPMMQNKRRGTTIPAMVPPEIPPPDLPAVLVSGFLMVEVNGCKKSELQAEAQAHEAGEESLASR